VDAPAAAIKLLTDTIAANERAAAGGSPKRIATSRHHSLLRYWFATCLAQGRTIDAGSQTRVSAHIEAICKPNFVKGRRLQVWWETIFWMCDPDDWTPSARAWLPESPSPQVLGRSAFGDLFVLDEGIWVPLPHQSAILRSVSDLNWFFGETLTSKTGMLQRELPQLRAARAAAGPLEWDEMYTYVPALALGGSEKTSKVERAKAREQLVILSQLAPIRRR